MRFSIRPLYLQLFLVSVRGTAEEVAVGTNRQLFLDDGIVDSQRSVGVTQQLNPPLRIRRVMKPNQPSEDLGFIFYCSVVDDHGVAKLFHGSYDAEKKKHFAVSASEDGIHWEDPDLGLCEYRGNRKNNLLPLDAVEASVFLDSNAPPEKRFRLLYSRYWPDPGKAGVYLASSPDGLLWKKSEARLLPFIPDSQHCGIWDSSLQKYVIYTRTWNPDRAVARVAVDDIEKPWPYDESVSPRYAWGKQNVPTLSREFPAVMSRDDRDPPGVQVYSNAVSRYLLAPGIYLAFPAMYQTFTGPDWKDRALNGNDGTFDIQFATSRDGITWKTLARTLCCRGFS